MPTSRERWLLATQAVLLLIMGIIVPFKLPLINLFDYVLLLALTGGLYLIARKQELPFWGYLGLFVVFILHGLGILGSYGEPVLGIFSFSIKYFGIGYDKYMHFIGSVGAALFFWGWLPLKRGWLHLLVIFLAVMGLAALNESLEFTGSYYGNFEKGGIITQEDGLPESDDPLQVYDTYFDLYFNIAGAIAGAILAYLLEWRDRRRTGKRKRG